ncbi:chromatin modification-related protein EAF1 B-like isoform X2 [Phoenix dactylifera]|uniref:Chromatin modification-related protein EAF1 B-like isoform X2 n=1 Tax=Phoenix dactylifera TaxID=42345 RepID=A0A8B7C322_PHODC|nr:chromatin modification-related protein EAF1 B-like isoform X2 [Phoenix dactylifera]
MGGIVDCGVGADTKTSPRRAAIEKAQAELQQECDVREERRRELDFLEKGGNPLDFKFAHAASISVQSTSLTDQLAEQYVISEARGSFALAASPHGDSVESSDRPGGSLSREPNIADNLLFLDGENSNLGGERNFKHSGKSGNITPLEQASQIDCSAKESEDSVIFRPGVKSQAYARRNRSRTSRDSGNVGSTDFTLRHGNRSLAIPSARPSPRNAKGSIWEAQVEDHAISSISNSKPASPNVNVVSKNIASDDHVDMELDTVQTHHTCTDMIKDVVPEGAVEVKSSENLQDNDHTHEHSHVIADRVTNGTTSRSSDVSGKDEALSVGFLPTLHESTEVIKDTSNAEKVNGFNAPDKNTTEVHDLNTKTCVADSVPEALSTSNIKTDPLSVNMTSTSVGNADGDQHLMLGKIDGSSHGDPKGHSMFEEASSRLENKDLKENNQLIAVDTPISGNDESRSVQPNPGNSVIHIKDEVEVCDGSADAPGEVSPFTDVQSMILNGDIPDRKLDKALGDSNSIDKSGIDARTVVSSTCEPAITAHEKRNSTSTSEVQNYAANHLKLAKKAQEDAVLKEARIIEAKLKRADELSLCNIFSEKRQKCHWDFVLEEMAWMANDFMQERLWKTTAAAQVCHWIASCGRPKFQQVNMWHKQKNVARTLAKAVFHFWRSADTLRTSGETPDTIDGECNSDMLGSWKIDGAKAEKHQGSTYIEAERSGHIPRLAIKDYAVRFLKYNSNISSYPVLAEAPTTPDRLCDTGILEMSWEDQHSEESLFYTVPPGAMQAYRESVESEWVHYKKMGNTIHQEDCEASMCDSVADGSRENAYEEDEGETGTYYLSGAFEGGLSSKFTHKRRKNMQQKSCAPRSYEVGTDLSYEPCLESKSGNQSLSFGKRPSSTLNVGSIPTKRVRSAARQRVVSPFSAGVTESLQVTSKTDVSSGDTNSFQDDQSSLHGGSLPRKNMEIESTVDFRRQLPYDGNEISTTKSRKKKKPKHLRYKNSLNLTDSNVLIVSGKGSLYEQRLQVDSTVQHEQKDHLKKRLENHQFESNENTVIYGQHAAKKPKLLKQLPETSPEALTPVTGSMPSPVASQMSNMSNTNRLIKIIANKDRGRKCKALKMAAGQSGSGSPWSNFEDQALVVLVHDMGPNWELVSDAINSTLQFKCIYRKPKECRERHKFLMDKSAGDGADSAEDSGSSQAYPSTLPGIPKGSARQLFQRLQGPLEEDTLKAHFEKIILLGQQLHSRRNQNDNLEPKQITSMHSSHMVALSQVCSSNLTGCILTPLDLCEAIASSPDVLSLGYQGSQTGGLAISSHQGSMASISTSNVNTMLQGSPGMVLGSSLPSPSAPLNVAPRDAQRYGVSRPTSMPVDDQRMQQYSQMLSGRSLQQSTMSAPGALPVGVDRGVRLLSGGNGIGMVCGMNRSMPMPRPSFQGMGPPGMLNMVSTGNMLPNSGHGMQNHVNVHPSVVSGSGNPMLRPRDALQMLRPGQNTEDHRHMLIQELQIQVSQGNGQVVTPFNGMSASFSSTTAPPSIQTFPVPQHQQSHQMPQQAHILGNSHNPHIQGTNQSSPQQQAYAYRFAKERPFQQRMIPQAQHPFSGSNAMSPIQNSSQIQQQNQTSSPVSASPSQVQHKQQQMPRNLQSSSGMPNQVMKQRQRQQVQQQPKQQQQQRQQSQPQAKLMKGLGRGGMLMQQNLPVDASQVSGFSSSPKNQVSDKHVQGFFPGNLGLSSTLPQTGNQQKMYSRVLPQSSKQMTSAPSHSDTCNQGSVHGSPSPTMLASQQPPVPSSSPMPNHHHQQQQQHQMNTSQQNVQRMVLQQNRQLNSDGRIHSSADQVLANQMIPTTSISYCTDSGTSVPVASSAAQWKPESSYNVGSPGPTAHLANSPPENLVGTETIIPPSSQGSVQRQFSGSVSMHGNSGQWQQQQPQPQQQQQRQAAQGTLYAQPSNSGPG